MAAGGMTRRALLRNLAPLALVWSRKGICQFAQSTVNRQTINVRVHEDRILRTIPSDFLGLGYEVSSVAIPKLLSGSNHVYVQLLRSLSHAGVIRIGGATSDYESYSQGGELVSSPKGTVVNRRSLEDLGSFLNATGWRLIWGLNLGQGTVAEVVEEAQAVSAATGKKLLAFEIGNEVDIFGGRHRQRGYSFDDYLAEFRRYKSAIWEKLPNAQFAGPDAAGKTDWVSQFAVAEGRNLRLLTEHYYRGGQKASSSLEMLLNPDPRLTAMLQTLQSTSSSSQVPFRICETNSFSGGGKPGVSNTFGAALWALDYLWTIASYGASGVNMETGLNQLGFISWYSPIGVDASGAYVAMPEYYGMLAFSRASKGQQVAVEVIPKNLETTAYATVSGNRVTATLINKGRTSSGTVTLQCNAPIVKATALRLSAPSLESKASVTLGGEEVSSGGSWQPRDEERVPISSRGAQLVLPPGSAAVVTLVLRAA